MRPVSVLAACSVEPAQVNTTLPAACCHLPSVIPSGVPSAPRRGAVVGTGCMAGVIPATCLIDSGPTPAGVPFLATNIMGSTSGPPSSVEENVMSTR